jgi:hypothetical protein
MLDSRIIKNGEEQYEPFIATNKKMYIQYDYRNKKGELFSTVKKSLEECREARNYWIEKKEGDREYEI